MLDVQNVPNMSRTLSFLSDCSSTSSCCAFKFFCEIVVHAFLSVPILAPFPENSKMFVILRPWQATLPESSPHAFFSDVHMIVLVELYLGQWHQQDLLPAVQGLRNGLPMFAACHMGTVEFLRFQIWVSGKPLRLSGSGHHCSASNFLFLNIIDISWVPPNRNAVHAWNCSEWTSSTSPFLWVQMNSKPETPKVTDFQFPQFNG